MGTRLLYSLPFGTILLIFVAILVVALEVGFRVGVRRRRTRRDGAETTGTEITLGSMLALLGLMLAFTYSFSMTRADLRKQATTGEVNAIGTAFLRADLAPEPVRTELRQALLDYARSRVARIEDLSSWEDLDALVARSLAAQAKLWPATKKAVAADSDMSEPFKASLVQAINDVLDAHTSKMAVVRDRLPFAVLGLLLFLAAMSMSVLGYKKGLSGGMSRWRTVLFALILAGLMFLIVDFDTVLRGTIRVSQESLLTLIDDLEAAMAP